MVVVPHRAVPWWPRVVGEVIWPRTGGQDGPEHITYLSSIIILYPYPPTTQLSQSSVWTAASQLLEPQLTTSWTCTDLKYLSTPIPFFANFLLLTSSFQSFSFLISNYSFQLHIDPYSLPSSYFLLKTSYSSHQPNPTSSLSLFTTFKTNLPSSNTSNLLPNITFISSLLSSSFQVNYCYTYNCVCGGLNRLSNIKKKIISLDFIWRLPSLDKA